MYKRQNLNSPGFPIDTDLTNGNSAQLNGLFGGLLDFNAQLNNGAGGSNPAFTGGVEIDANNTLGDFIFVQPNGLGGFPTDNATYTFDFNNPVDNLSFLTGGVNNGDILVYEAFLNGVSVPITAANFSNLIDDVVVQHGNELFNAIGQGGTDLSLIHI